MRSALQTMAEFNANVDFGSGLQLAGLELAWSLRLKTLEAKGYKSFGKRELPAKPIPHGAHRHVETPTFPSIKENTGIDGENLRVSRSRGQASPAARAWPSSEHKETTEEGNGTLQTTPNPWKWAFNGCKQWALLWTFCKQAENTLIKRLSCSICEESGPDYPLRSWKMQESSSQFRNMKEIRLSKKRTLSSIDNSESCAVVTKDQPVGT